RLAQGLEHGGPELGGLLKGQESGLYRADRPLRPHVAQREDRPVDEEVTVDPVGMAVGAATKVGSAMAAEGGGVVTDLTKRMFGPAADEIGKYLGQWMAFRLGNATAIIEGAE